MKKLITTLLLSILSVLCVFAFAACGGGDGEKEQGTEQGTENGGGTENGSGTESNEDKTTVTEEEWKAAIAVIAERKTSIASAFDVETDEGTEKLILAVDVENNIMHLNDKYKFNEGEEGEESIYVWKAGDGKYYMADEIDKELNKQAIDKEFYDATVKDFLWHYTGANILNGVNASEKFSEFTYDEENKVYAATLPVDSSITDFSDDAELLIYFENGIIVKMQANLIKNKNYYVFNYEYGKTVTIPSDILEAPATPTGE